MVLWSKSDVQLSAAGNLAAKLIILNERSMGLLDHNRGPILCGTKLYHSVSNCITLCGTKLYHSVPRWRRSGVSQQRDRCEIVHIGLLYDSSSWSKYLKFFDLPIGAKLQHGAEDNVQPSDDEAVHDGDEDGDAEADQASLQHGGRGDLHQRACRDLRRCSEGGLRRCCSSRVRSCPDGSLRGRPPYRV